MGEGLAKVGLQQLARAAGMYVATLVTHGLTFALWNHRGDLQMILLTGPMALPVLMLSARRYWPAYGVGWWAAMMTFIVARGYPLPGMALAYLGCVLLLYGTALLLERFRGDQSIDDFPRLWWFLLVAAVLLPLTTTGMALWLNTVLPTIPWLHKQWWHMALAMGLGFVLLTPAILSLSNPASALRRDMPGLRVWLITALILALLWVAWGLLGNIDTLRAILLIAPAPLLIYVALCAQIPGVSAVNMALGAIAMQLSLTGHGPFLQGDAQSSTLTVQLWMLGMSVVSLLFAALVEQRRTVRNALVASSSEAQHLAGRLIVAQEQERARVARDLHDDINQRLALASMQLSSLRQKVEEHHRHDVTQLQNELISLSGDVRALSHGLHPSTLEHTGLALALGELCRTHRHRGGPAIALHIPEEPDGLPCEVTLCLYRVTQEALRNALKHAHAKRIDVALTIAGNQVELTITDDGRGFDAQSGGWQGLGLMSISERARLLGGSCRLRSALGEGTELCVCLPLQMPS